ncbi:ATP-binding protein [Alkaliphilus hydrothermalis]|uniref:DNA replication protein DnaC n=1 Tax=Alkaliphilus hydrothermalis TaxID=1482730 RepID=A0ABS2NRJ1_9FIRM|nr:ATP-binding protein [Alkaliphilus hydrothermalis]MBM7615550.1 DNA replication protein DnaC [Alkaliphilus hydrothermalis]
MKNNKSFINDILRDLERRRDKAKREKEQRIEEIYSKIPRIAEIDSEITRISINISRSILNQAGDPTKALSELKSRLEVLKQEKAFLLTENNVPVQYLEEQYQCAQCQDRGFLTTGEKCSCLKQQLINRAYSMSNLTNVLSKENFQSFNINLFSNESVAGQDLSPRENMLQVLNVCEGFVFNFEKNNEENLLFYGPTGLGKTFLTNCIAKALLDKGKIVVYQTAFKIFEVLEGIRFHNAQDKSSYQLLFDADLLIIDDLGTEITNTFTNSELFNIINSRLLANKKTIISTNLTLKDIMTSYDDRIFSRLFSKYTLLKFYGNDLRWQT